MTNQDNMKNTHLTPKQEIILKNLFRDIDKPNVYEYILEDGEELTLRELKTLNEMGYVYHSELTHIDFEDEDSSGETITRYMNIYYFSLANLDIHEHQMPA
jgi:hypothetical protein